MTKDEALKLALDALEAAIDVPCYGGHPKQEAAAAAIKEALAQPPLPVQEPAPVQEKSCRTCLHRDTSIQGVCGVCRFYSHYICATPPAPLPVQEPVLEPACPVCSATPTFSLDVRVNEWSGQCKHCGVEGSPATTEAEAKQKWIVWHHKKLYTTPQKRPWVGLTDEEASWCQAPSTIQTWKRIEAKLKEKNT